MAGAAFGEFFSSLAGFFFICSTMQQLLPHKLSTYINNFWDRFLGLFYPYIRVTFQDYTSGRRNEAHTWIKNYLGSKSSTKAKYMKADLSSNSKDLAISLDEGDEIVDVYKGVKVWWRAHADASQDPRPGRSMMYEKHYYLLVFNKRNKDLVMGEYLEHVMKQGKEMEFKNKKRRLYTNNKYDDWFWKGCSWTYMNFDHPSRFDTLAMDPKKKQEIIDDLEAFKRGKKYYEKIGKAWKRGYLLYGPPGTGKSTMIAAIANYMEYDIYDLELTSVKDNGELKQLLMDTKSKSIIVIEDIDCSLDLTGKRKEKEKESMSKNEDQENSKDSNSEKGEKQQGITLSGLLNFIDGIWSACGKEKIIVFTTNHLEKLDPALIRRGRMDKHIELSYCKFEEFKVLAKNYLGIDSHPLFKEIESLLQEVDITPCDVAENLMPKNDPGNAEICLRNLISALNVAKEKAREVDNAPLEGKDEEESNKVNEEVGRSNRKTAKCTSLVTFLRVSKMTKFFRSSRMRKLV